MNRKLLIAMFVLLSVAVACKREAPVATPEASSGPPSTPAAIAAPAAENDLSHAGVQPDAAGFSAKAFAGTFKGELPCADCPGLDETLVLAPDGSFTLTDIYRERPQGTRSIAGSWTIEDTDKRIRLDPNTKAEQDRLYAITSNDEIKPLGAYGKPAASGPEYRLRRAP
jgi:copper homeostasis protein (lipoprotein)